jgi:hypothetical protein
MRIAVPRFSALALVAVGFVVATGVYAAWLQVGSLPGLETPYGRVLLLKLAAAAVAMGVGAVNLVDGGRSRPLLGGLRRRIGVEVALAVVVVGLTANLTGGAPPRGEPSVTIPQVAGSEGIELSFHDLPPGPNQAIVTLPPPGLHVGSVELALERLDATASALIPLGPLPGGVHGSQFVGDVLIPADSTWSATVLGHDLDHVEVFRARYTVEMGATALNVDRGPGLNLGTIIALVMLVTALAGIGFWLGGGTLPRAEPMMGRRALFIGSLAGLAVGGSLLLFAPLT